MSAKKFDPVSRTGLSGAGSVVLGGAALVPLVAGNDAALVIDVGSRFTKVGIAGESTPRCIVRTILQNGDSVFLERDFTSKTAHDQLYTFFKELFYRKLSLIIANRRVLILESVLSPTEQRNLIASVLFERMQIYENVPMLNCWQSSPKAGSKLRETMQKLMQKCGRFLDGDGAEKSVSDKSFQFARSDWSENDVSDVWEELMLRCCFVAPMEIGHKLQETLLSILNDKEVPNEKLEEIIGNRVGDSRVWVKGTRFFVPAFVRASVCEVLFMPGDQCDKSLVQLVFEAILRTPMDMRRSLLQRLILSGGCALIPGFHARFASELCSNLRTGEYSNRLPVLRDPDALELDAVQFFLAPGKERIEQWLPWMGGSIIGATECLALRSLAHETWLQRAGKLPDWTDQVDMQYG